MWPRRMSQDGKGVYHFFRSAWSMPSLGIKGMDQGVYLVRGSALCLWFVKPNKRDRPKKPAEPDPRHAPRGVPVRPGYGCCTRILSLDCRRFLVHNGSRSMSLPQQGYGSTFFSQALRKGAMVSMGIGKMVVEFFSAEISTRVCR